MILVEEKDKRFYLDKSTIESAGMGVFALEDIAVGSVLEIIGVMIDVGSISDQCSSFASNYKFAAKFSGEYNRHIIPLGFGGMVNHTVDKKNQNVELRYIKRNTNNENAGSAVYYFIKDVKKGQEILGNYGEKWNNKIEEKNDWQMFLDLELYNLRHLRGGQNARN
jgi:hypothetical protein